MPDVPPIRREVLVDAGPGLAFTVFTEQIGAWWPLAEPSVYGGAGAVAFTDSDIVETSPDGGVAVWGTVTRWDPPSALAFTWHPGRGADRASAVTVTFEPAGDQTLVRLEHTGWDSFDDPAAARAEYDEGWPMVLESYREAVALDDEGDEGDTWVALMHRPGPGAPTDGSLFADPRFGEHIAFLRRMADAGHLVAAGSLADEMGAGMTILRLGGPDRLAEAERLATQDDASVAGGFFTVTARPWNVVMHVSA